MLGIRSLLICLSFGLTVSGCMGNTTPVSDRNSPLTQGNVQLVIKSGVTTKAQILEAFGAANVTTRDADGREVWTYQRSGQATESASQSGGWTILLAGQSGSSSGFQSSSRMMTLIIKFNSEDIVYDFNSRSSNF